MPTPADLDSCTLRGKAELKVSFDAAPVHLYVARVPCSTRLALDLTDAPALVLGRPRSIRLHCRQCVVSRVLVEGVPAEFRHPDACLKEVRSLSWHAAAPFTARAGTRPCSRHAGRTVSAAGRPRYHHQRAGGWW